MKVRMEKINSEIRKALSEIISHRVKDPRVAGIVSVLGAEATPDLKYCKVLISVYGKNEEEVKTTFSAIEGCGGFIRHELGREVSLRVLPELRFVLDDSISYSFRIAKMIDDLSEEGK